jgi:hypothetical protein
MGGETWIGRQDENTIVGVDMTKRKLVGVLGVIAIASGVVLGAGAQARVADTAEDLKSDNIELLKQAPIELDEGVLADGSDLAFQNKLIAAGSFQGTGFYKIVSPRQGHIKQVGMHICPGSQGDVSLWGKYLFVSIDAPATNNAESNICNNTATNRSDSSLEKEGIRIVDISNVRQPRQVGFVETDCGSHTHTLVPDGKKLFMYVSSYPISGQGPSCNHATHRKFSIVEIDLKNPAKSDVVATPALPPDTVGCHDFTVFPARDFGMAACLGVWLTLDISDPADPQILSETRNPLIELDHSTALTWDGKYALIGDEHAGAAGGGGCSPNSDSPVGALWIYDVRDPENPEELSHISLPRVPTVDDANEAQRFRCTTHNFNIVPMKKKNKYVATVSYYSGGIAAIDFSDPEDPQEVAHYVHLGENGVNPDTWASYWYNGKIYTNDHLSKYGVGVYELKGTGQKDAFYFKGNVNPQTQIANFRK